MEDDIQVHGIAFRQDGLVEVSYAEARDQTPDIQVMKIMMLDPKRAGRQIQAILSDIREVIDMALIRMQDDPETLPGMGR